MDDPARFLASRVQQEADLPAAATRAQVLAACALRGIPVGFVARLDARGMFLPHPEPGILLHAGARARDIGHELCHAILWENTSLGIDYGPPEFAPTDEESACDRFAAYLGEP